MGPNRECGVAYRAAQDERRLRNFLSRQEQIDAFLDLVKGPDDLWALHFIGLGGVGKTTLIRYITAKLAPSCGRLTARVGFDHMSPNYPVRQPEQLLVELADELRTHSEPEIFENFQNRVYELHDALSVQPDGSQALAALRHPLFDKVFRSFVDWLRLLPKEIVLILDTCRSWQKSNPLVSRPAA